MIKLSNIYKCIIFFTTILMTGGILLCGFDIISDIAIKALVAIISIVIGISCPHLCKKNEVFNNVSKRLDYFTYLYVIVFFISIFITYFNYNYSLLQLAKVSIPYLYFFLVYPILYIMIVDDSCMKLVGQISVIAVFFLILKALSWYLYNFKGIVIFKTMLFEYANWIRSGRQRIYPGYLVGIILAYFASKAFGKKKSVVYKILTLFIVFFFGIITDARVQFAIGVVTVGVVFLSIGKRDRRLIKWGIVLLVVVFLIISGVASGFIESFSISSKFGNSTNNRIETFLHYWKLLEEKNYIWGLGLISTSNVNAYSIIYKNSYSMYYIDDLGIIGEFVRKGIGGLLLYFIMYKKFAYVFEKKFDNSIDVAFVKGTIFYFAISCIGGMNVFDPQRAYDLPFYLAIYFFFIYQKDIRNNES